MVTSFLYGWLLFKFHYCRKEGIRSTRGKRPRNMLKITFMKHEWSALRIFDVMQYWRSFWNTVYQSQRLSDIYEAHWMRQTSTDFGKKMFLNFFSKMEIAQKQFVTNLHLSWKLITGPHRKAWNIFINIHVELGPELNSSASLVWLASDMFSCLWKPCSVLMKRSSIPEIPYFDHIVCIQPRCWGESKALGILSHCLLCNLLSDKTLRMAVMGCSHNFVKVNSLWKKIIEW